MATIRLALLGRAHRAGPPARVQGAASRWLRRLPDHGRLLSGCGASARAVGTDGRKAGGMPAALDGRRSADGATIVSRTSRRHRVRVFTDVRDMLAPA